MDTTTAVDPNALDARALYNRLYNRKFAHALAHVKHQPEMVRAGVEALAILFGNQGWNEIGGVMADVQNFMVAALLRDCEAED